MQVARVAKLSGIYLLTTASRVSLNDCCQ